MAYFVFLKGGGIETDYYTHWRRTTHSIEKMTHLPDTIARLYDACADLKSQSWLLKLEGSGWMKYIETCMTAAYKTAVFVSKDSEKYILLSLQKQPPRRFSRVSVLFSRSNVFTNFRGGSICSLNTY